MCIKKGNGMYSLSSKYGDDLVNLGEQGSIDNDLACSMLEKTNSIASSSAFGGTSNVKRKDDLACSRIESERPRPAFCWCYRVSVESLVAPAEQKNLSFTVGGGSLSSSWRVYLVTKVKPALPSECLLSLKQFAMTSRTCPWARSLPRQ